MLFFTRVWIILAYTYADAYSRIPSRIQEQYYDSSADTTVEITVNSMSNRGESIDVINENDKDYKYLFKSKDCYKCVLFSIRSQNVIQIRESKCFDMKDAVPKLIDVCDTIDPSQSWVTVYNKYPKPVSCRNSIQGVFHLASKNPDVLIGESSNSDPYITSCKTSEEENTQFSIRVEESAKKLILETPTRKYKYSLSVMVDICTSELTLSIVNYTCLGDFFIDNEHYFVAVNQNESLDRNKYRCFLINTDGILMGLECSSLKTSKTGVEMRLTPAKAQPIIATCRFPNDFNGTWNVQGKNSEIQFNSTHMSVSEFDGHQRKITTYVCREQNGTRYMLTKIGKNGCKQPNLCFDFLARHQNMIRFKKGKAVFSNQFDDVCSLDLLPNETKYDLMIFEDPDLISCPIPGKYKFKDKENFFSASRLRRNSTSTHVPQNYNNCEEILSIYSVCDDHKRISINNNICLNENRLSRIIGANSFSDYHMYCIGNWKEGNNLYLLTKNYLNQIHCWLYQCTVDNCTLIPLSSSCQLDESTSFSKLHLYPLDFENKKENCTKSFDGGSNPWTTNRGKENEQTNNGFFLNFSLFKIAFLLLFVLFFNYFCFLI